MPVSIHFFETFVFFTLARFSSLYTSDKFNFISAQRVTLRICLLFLIGARNAHYYRSYIEKRPDGSLECRLCHYQWGKGGRPAAQAHILRRHIEVGWLIWQLSKKSAGMARLGHISTSA